MLKTIILLFIMFCFFNLSAQKESNIKLKIEAGALWTSKPNDLKFPSSSGFFLHVEPKVKTSKNTIIGLRIGTVLNSQRIKNSDPNQFYITFDFDGTANWLGISGNEVISFVPTFDYYFNEKSFRPYLGLGLGYYFLATSNTVRVTNISNGFELSVNNQVGFLLRGGLDVAKFIVGLEFNFIPKADVEIPNGQIIGKINNSSIGLSIGYTIGLRKNSK